MTTTTTDRRTEGTGTAANRDAGKRDAGAAIKKRQKAEKGKQKAGRLEDLRVFNFHAAIVRIVEMAEREGEKQKAEMGKQKWEGGAR